jgi:hypothetical protein
MVSLSSRTVPDAVAGLSERAQAVLDRNRRDGWTCPARDFYPHQWLWDSCFVAIGLAHTDAQRAAGELRALFRGQWSNGMLPHMIFAPDEPDVGSRRIWQSQRFHAAPRDVETYDLKKSYTIVIVTHSMQQAARVSDYTAFFWLGRLVEFDRTEKIFTAPAEQLTEDYVTGRFG